MVWSLVFRQWSTVDLDLTYHNTLPDKVKRHILHWCIKLVFNSDDLNWLVEASIENVIYLNKVTCVGYRCTLFGWFQSGINWNRSSYHICNSKWVYWLHFNSHVFNLLGYPLYVGFVLTCYNAIYIFQSVLKLCSK